jgi:5-methylcytosine-specific restriction endonuclease McrA
MSTQSSGKAGVAVWDQGEIKIIIPPRAKRIAGRRWQRIVREIVWRDQGICWLCGLGGANSADHVIALADGGHPTDYRNLRAAHLRCNLSRSAHRTNALRRQRRHGTAWIR